MQQENLSAVRRSPYRSRSGNLARVSDEDYSTFTEAEALALTLNFGEDEDWSLWKVRRDGSGNPSMLAVGCGPARPA